jgi:hypothetical protein
VFEQKVPGLIVIHVEVEVVVDFFIHSFITFITLKVPFAGEPAGIPETPPL